MRVVLDANVFISALLSPTGTPARVLAAWHQGVFELIVSPLLLVELRRALAYPKLRHRITNDEADEVIDWLTRSATMAADPVTPPPVHSEDPGDDYLLTLAIAQDAVLVSGDGHVLDLGAHLPIYSPRGFLRLVDSAWWDRGRS